MPPCNYCVSILKLMMVTYQLAVVYTRLEIEGTGVSTSLGGWLWNLVCKLWSGNPCGQSCDMSSPTQTILKFWPPSILLGLQDPPRIPVWLLHSGNLWFHQKCKQRSTEASVPIYSAVITTVQCVDLWCMPHRAWWRSSPWHVTKGCASDISNSVYGTSSI
jgi:hypothetical protein